MIGPGRNESLNIISGKRVAVIYESQWCVGQVLQYDKSNNTYFELFSETTDQQNRV